MGAARRIVAVVALVGVGGAVQAVTGAGAAPSELRIAGTPALYPTFSPGVHDYVSRCGGSLKLSVAAPTGTTVSVDGGRARSGSFTSTTKLRGGQGLVATVRRSGRTSDYHFRCLPDDFPAWNAKRTGRTQAQWYVVTPVGGYSLQWVIVFDSHGVPVWWKNTEGRPFNATLMPDGNLAWFRWLKRPGGGPRDHGYEVHRLDGTLVRTLRTKGVLTDFHEIQQLPNGNYLLDAYRPRSGVDLSRFGGPKDGVVEDAEIQELTPSGKRVWSWSSRGHIALKETGRWWHQLNAIESRQPPAKRRYDVVHLNSIAPDGDGYVISCRHQDAIYRIERKSGKIDWKLGGTHTDKSLSIVGDEQPPRTLGAQHDARVRPDGTITAYDNQTGHGAPPRDVRFRVDPGARTATLLEQLTNPDVPSSGWGGGARKLSGGNWVTSWNDSPFVTETTPSGKRLFWLELVKSSTYRAFPVPFGELAATRLRAGMDAMHPR